MRLIVVVLLLITAGALGMIGYRVAVPSRPVAVNATPVAAAPVTVNYLVADRPLGPGTLVRDSDLDAKSSPVDQVPAGAIIDDETARAGLRGGLVQRYLDAGALITADAILRPREHGFLAAVLKPGTRAVSIGVDPISGVGGLIWPGDRVDVILTQDLDHTPGSAKQIVSETVLTDVRVIAVDQDIVQGAPSTGGVTGKLASTVTLEVTSDSAERLAVAQQLGRLSLAIRASESTPATAQTDAARQSAVVSGDDVSPALARANAGTGASKVQVIQGDKRSEVDFQ